MKALGIMFGALSLFSLVAVYPSGVQGAEPAPVTSPQDITGGDFPPEHYVVLPVPRGDLEAVKKNPLLHKDVLDDHGNKVGTLEKLILDTKTGKIAYAVISLEDGRLAPVPWSDLKTTREKNATIIKMTKEQLETAVGATAKEIKAMMRPGMLSEHHTIKGELLKIDAGDYVIKDQTGGRARLHLENGTKIQGDPKAGDMIEATVNDFDTAISINSHSASQR
jgi:sporulation protein YlmC with PRC-barrel domain